MAVFRKQVRERGLPSLNQARVERQRAFVLGKVRMPGVPLHFWLWSAIGLSVFGVVYWRIAQGELESARSRVMADQRAIAVSLGPKLFPVRDRVEAWAQALAGAYAGDRIADALELERIQAAGSIYLRMRQRHATDSKSLRRAAAESLRDGFTSCLFVTRSKRAAFEGRRCRTTTECHPGQLCNEWNVCAEPEQPFNLRLVYRTLRVLSDDWTDEVRGASSELALAAYQRDLESVARRDVPVTLDLLARARYFTLVLDEDPKDGLPAALTESETDQERIQRVPHFARVGIWDLKQGDLVLRLRREVKGEFLTLGRRRILDPENRAAQQRQVNGCQLALQVREAFGDRSALPASLQELKP